MADETPFGRYTYPGRDDVWVQFKAGPYRMRTKREWDDTRDEAKIYAFLMRYVESWSLKDLDGKAVPVPTFAAEPTEVKEGEVDERIAWADDIEVSVISFLISSFTRLIHLDAARPPKAS